MYTQFTFGANGTDMNNQLELVQIVPDTYLPVQMIVAKLREQLRMYETTRQLRQTGGRRVLR